MGGAGRVARHHALVSDGGRWAMTLLTRIWLKRLFWALVVVAVAWLIATR